MSEYYQTQTSLITKNLKRKIEAIIHRIESQYRCNQGLILTEADLKCLLFQQLQELFSETRNCISGDAQHLITVSMLLAALKPLGMTKQ